MKKRNKIINLLFIIIFIMVIIFFSILLWSNFWDNITGKLIDNSSSDSDKYANWCSWTDVNKDRKVNSQDVTIVRNHFTGFGTVCNVSNRWCNWTDVNKDGKVNSEDVTIIRNSYTGFFGKCYGCIDSCSVYQQKKCLGSYSQVCNDWNSDYCIEWGGDSLCLNGCDDNDGECNQLLNSYHDAFDSCNINFVENSNPADYLESHIYPLKESDWMNYTPLVIQVQNLTKDKNNDKDKAIAIANWVVHSRPYDFSNENITPANLLFSVIDIYNESTGVCFDAAIITVAMLRLVGIPARITFPIIGTYHARTQAYIDNRWITIDSTFGIFSAQYDIKEFPPCVILYFDKIENPKYYYPRSLQKDEILSSEVYKQYDLVNDNLFFSNITFANIASNTKLYSNDSISVKNKISIFFEIIRTDDKDFYYAIYNNTIFYNISSAPLPFYWKKLPKNIISTILPRIMFLHSYDKYVPGSKVNSVTDMTGTYRYLETVKIPLGKYRIIYYVNLPMDPANPDIGGRMNITYSDFEVIQGNTIKLSPDRFVKEEEANQTYFEDIINRINDTWNNCMNDPQI